MLTLASFPGLRHPAFVACKYEIKSEEFPLFILCSATMRTPVLLQWLQKREMRFIAKFTHMANIE